MSEPRTTQSSPFFKPSTPHVVVVRHTPGGTRREVQQKHVDEQKSGILGCTANLINAIVGSGIVGIPYAIKQAGFVAGVVLIFFLAAVTEKSLRLLISTAKHAHCPTYETAAEAAFGIGGFRFVAANMFVMAYGAMLSYLMIVKDSFAFVFGIDMENLLMKRTLLLIISLGVMVPISSQRDMASLSKTSRLSVLIDSLLVVLLAFNAPFVRNTRDMGGISALLQDTVHWDTIFVGIGVLSFAFVCQHSAFIIAGSLEKPTYRRWSIATASALTVSAFLELGCGLCGYLGYLQDTEGNVLNNLDADSLSANVARAMLGFTMLFVYPLESFVARHVCVVLLFAGRTAHEGDDSSVLNRRDRRVGLTVILYILAVTPALVFEDLGPVLAITGAVGGSCLSYIGPGIVFMGIHGGTFLKLVQNSWIGSVMSSTNDMDSGDFDRPTHAVETTPLVRDENEASNLAQPRSHSQENENIIVVLIKHLLWYILLMPLWVRIAEAGKRGLTQHIHDMALKSPHPIRIGDVEYSRATVDEMGRVNTDADGAVLFPLGRNRMSAERLPVLGKVMSFDRSKNVTGDINKMIGQKILESQKKQQQVVEADPQAGGPGWYDFGVAIFYMLFGLVALVAGVFSLLNQ